MGVVLFGVLQFGAGFGLVYWGSVQAPAGLGQILLAAVPLITLGLALAHRQERFTWEGGVGATLAISGIAVVFASGLDGDIPLTSMLALVGGAFCWAEALIVSKWFPPVHPAAMNSVAMGVGAILLLALAVIFDERHTLPDSGTAWAAQAYLVVAGSIAVFWLYLFVLRRWTASAASYQLVLIPLVTVLVSSWLQDERITPAFATGTLLVLVGVYVGALEGAHRSRRGGPGPRPRRPTAA